MNIDPGDMVFLQSYQCHSSLGLCLVSIHKQDAFKLQLWKQLCSFFMDIGHENNYSKMIQVYFFPHVIKVHPLQCLPRFLLVKRTLFAMFNKHVLLMIYACFLFYLHHFFFQVFSPHLNIVFCIIFFIFQ